MKLMKQKKKRNHILSFEKIKFQAERVFWDQKKKKNNPIILGL